MLMIEAFLLVLGLLGLWKIGVDLYPEVDPPVITITTEYNGVSPTEIETLISKVIEEEVNQLGGIERLMSTSRDGVSQIVIEFKLAIDARQIQTEVRDKVARIRSKLPNDIEEPLVERLDFADRPILQLALKAKASDLTNAQLFQLRDFAENQVKPVLQQVDGVGQVNVFGGLEREIQVDLDLQRLMLWKLTPDDVANAIRGANRTVSGGEIAENPTSRGLRLLGEYASASEVPETIVKVLPGGRVVRVKDVATVRDFFKDRTSIATLNGSPSVVMEIKKQSGANTVAVADALQDRLGTARKILPEGYALESVFDGSHKIRMSLHDVAETLIIAGLLAVAVVYLFLGSMQSTFVTGIALPMTVIATFFVLFVSGMTINIMTLLGLTLAVGLLLDDAIVVRENIWEKLEKGMAPREAALEGTREVYVAVIATSLTILATFIPVLLIPGVVGRFFAAFALTVCIAVSLSLFDALTMAPLLSAHLVTKAGKHAKKPNWVLRHCQEFGGQCVEWYRSILKWALHHPLRILLGSTVLFFFAIFLVPMIGFTFLPESENGELEIALEAPPGTTIQKMQTIAGEIEAQVKKQPEVLLISTRLGNEFEEENIGTIYVQLTEYGHRDRSTSQIKSQWRKDLASLAKREKLNLSIRDAGNAAGGRPVSAAVQGADNLTLERISEPIVTALGEKVPELVNLESSLRPGRSELQFQVDRERATGFGLNVDRIGAMLRGLFEGLIAGQFREKGEEYDIRVRLNYADRIGVSTFDGLTVPNDAGAQIPLGAVVFQQPGASPTKIIRINQRRALLLEGDLAPGAPLATVIAKFKETATPFLPTGYAVEFQGGAKSLKDLQVGMMVAMLLGAVFIYMIMASLYESFVLPFSILLTLPLACVGAIAALLFTGSMLDVYSVIGIILLMGLVTKNAILVVDYVEHLRREGRTREEALLEGGVRRLRPIMMTTIAMVMGMLPVAIGYGELNKARAGMGIACIGGLLSSTLLSLLVVPCAYIYLDRFRTWSRRFVASISHRPAVEGA